MKKNILLAVLSASLILSLTACDKNPTPTPQITPTPPSVDNTTSPKDNLPVKDETLSMEPPALSEEVKEETPKTLLELEAKKDATSYESAKIIYGLYKKTLEDSFKSNDYSLTFYECIDTESLGVAESYNSKILNLYKAGDNFYFNGYDKFKYYDGRFVQKIGKSVESVSAQNVESTQSMSALEDLKIKNGINSVYDYFANIVLLDDNYANFYNQLAEMGYLKFSKGINEVDQMTTYSLVVPNLNDIKNSGLGASKYLTLNSANFAEYAMTSLTFTINSENKLVNIDIKDGVSYGNYAKAKLTRKANFDYSIAAISPSQKIGNGMLTGTANDNEGKPMDISVGRIITRKPNAVELSCGIDEAKWTANFMPFSGKYRETSFNANKKSGYNIHGITAGISKEEVMTKVGIIVNEAPNSITGYLTADDTVYCVTVNFENNLSTSISIRLMPNSNIWTQIPVIKNAGEMTTSLGTFNNTVSEALLSELIENKTTDIMSYVYKSLNRPVSIDTSLVFVGKNLRPYESDKVGTQITTNGEYKVLYVKDDISTDAGKLVKNQVFDTLLKYLPEVKISEMTKTTEDELTKYSFKKDMLGDNSAFKDTVLLALDYPLNVSSSTPKSAIHTERQDKINSYLKWVEAHLDNAKTMDITLTVNNQNFITNLNVKTYNTRDSIEFDMDFTY